MNFNAEFYKYSFTEKNVSKFALLTFFLVIGSNKIVFLTSILNNINQCLVILATENIFILVILILLSEIWNSGLSFHVNASRSVCVFYVNTSHSVCECHG